MRVSRNMICHAIFLHDVFGFVSNSVGRRELIAIVGLDDAFPFPDHVAEMVVDPKCVPGSLLGHGAARSCGRFRAFGGRATLTSAGAFAAWRASPLTRDFAATSGVAEPGGGVVPGEVLLILVRLPSADKQQGRLLQ